MTKRKPKDLVACKCGGTAFNLERTTNLLAKPGTNPTVFLVVCADCGRKWRPEGAPVTKPTVPEVLPLVRAYYAKPNNGAGGSLHLVLDDGNTEDSSVAFCLKYAEDAGDMDGVALAAVLMQMSRTQRQKLYMADKWQWKERP